MSAEPPGQASAPSGEEPEEGSSRAEVSSFLREIARAPSLAAQRLLPPALRAPSPFVGTRLGRFRIEACIGAGGMGEVFRALDESLQRPVALKLLTSVDHARDEVIAEARRAAAARSPFIISIYEVGEVDGRTFIAMEYLEGDTLRSRLARPTPMLGVLQMAKALAGAVADVHRSGILHCDLKPENVVVLAGGHLKLVDFGLACPIGGREPPRGGTRRYMPPEQGRGEPLTPAADLFALGVMLCEAWLGGLPAPGEREPGCLASTIRARARRAPRRERRGAVQLADVLARCLEVEAGRRWSDANALLAALEAVDTHSSRLHPGLAVLAGLVPLLAAGGLWLAHSRGSLNATHERRVVQGATGVADARLSHDGQRVAWIDGRRLSIRRLEPLSTSSIDLPEGVSPRGLEWMPGDQALVVADASGLWLVGGDPPRRISRRVCRDIALSPQGKWLACLDDEGLRRIPVDDGDEKLLLARIEGESLDGLSWSPDGGQIAYGRWRWGAGSRVTLESVSVDAEKRLVLFEGGELVAPAPRAGLFFSWAPDGRILYASYLRSPTGFDCELRALSVDLQNGKAQRSEPLKGLGPGTVSGLQATLGNRLALLRSTTRFQTYWAPLLEGGGLGALRRLTQGDGNERPCAFTEDGKGLLLMTDVDGSWDLHLRRLGSEEAAPVVRGPEDTTFGQFVDAHHLLYWSLPAVGIGEQQWAWVLRRPLEGDVPIVVRRTDKGLTRFRCEAFGERCLWGELEGADLVLSDFSAVDGRDLGRRWRITGVGEHAHQFAVSQDLSRVAVSRPGGTTAMLGLASGFSRMVELDRSCELGSAAFSSDASSLFVVADCWTEPAHRLYRVAWDGAATMVWSDDVTALSSPVASADGRFLALSVHDRRTDVSVATLEP
ncbi:MAG: protein kinase [Deltaproteobacteria bacterium]|nr:protein kinase [Deltaproteobacteria bacterium]